MLEDYMVNTKVVLEGLLAATAADAVAFNRKVDESYQDIYGSEDDSESAIEFDQVEEVTIQKFLPKFKRYFEKYNLQKFKPSKKQVKVE